MPGIQSVVLGLARDQDYVVTTAQCVALGASRQWVSRQVGSGRWQRLYRGVFVVHPGPVGWRSRARAALLHAGPGALLSHGSAAHVFGFAAAEPASVDVTIPHGRRVSSAPGLRVHRRSRRAPARWSGLPVVSRGDAALDLVEGARDDDGAVGALCAAVRHRVRPEDVLEALARRPRARRRVLVSALLALVEEGIESPLELRYHRGVERAHGLPSAELQVRHVVGGRWIRADRRYRGLGVRVELDGELAHPGGRTDADTWRDNAVLIAVADLTLRYRWRHVVGSPCETAAQVAAALRSKGWRGTPWPCGPGCPVR